VAEDSDSSTMWQEVLSAVQVQWHWDTACGCIQD
jgi:hypothetical protein